MQLQQAKVELEAVVALLMCENDRLRQSRLTGPPLPPAQQTPAHAAPAGVDASFAVGSTPSAGLLSPVALDSLKAIRAATANLEGISPALLTPTQPSASLAGMLSAVDNMLQ